MGCRAAHEAYPPLFEVGEGGALQVLADGGVRSCVQGTGGPGRTAARWCPARWARARPSRGGGASSSTAARPPRCGRQADQGGVEDGGLVMRQHARRGVQSRGVPGDDLASPLRRDVPRPCAGRRACSDAVPARLLLSATGDRDPQRWRPGAWPRHGTGAAGDLQTAAPGFGLLRWSAGGRPVTPEPAACGMDRGHRLRKRPVGQRPSSGGGLADFRGLRFTGNLSLATSWRKPVRASVAETGTSSVGWGGLRRWKAHVLACRCAQTQAP